MLKQELENQLQSLRLKWKIYPKSSIEPNWFKFKCDKCLALGLIEQIKKIDGEKEILSPEEMEKIFTSNT